jgi:hypothetical protein
MADFVLALADFDRRRGWERLGHASLFAFLNVELGLSKGAAFVRSSAARLVQAHPEAVEPLRDGRLWLSSVAELGRVATPASFAEVLPRFFGCSSREAREVAAAIAPREAPPVRDQVTRLAPVDGRRASITSPGMAMTITTPPAPGPARSLAPYPASAAATLTLAAPLDSEPVRAHEPDLTHPARVHAPCDQVEPLTAELRRLHITVSRQFLRELETAKGGLSHAIPNATTEQVLHEALRLLLEKQARSRGEVKRPRNLTMEPTVAASAPEATRVGVAAQAANQIVTEPRSPRREGPRESIPAAVRRAVWARDGGRCSWLLDSGGRCGSTHWLELDHLVPWATWGGTTEANLRVVCAAHNRLAAREAFGERWMGKYGGRRA